MILAFAGSSWACGPDFPMVLVHDRAATLLDLPEASFLSEATRLVPVGDAMNRGEQSTGERIWLTDAHWTQVQHVRNAADGTEARHRAEGLPDDVRLYTVGATDWHLGEIDLACAQFAAVLALPAPERALREVWAAFMVAKCSVGADRRPAWERVRTLARSGRDPAGLAFESLGEQGRDQWEAGDLRGSVASYAAQAAAGSSSGATSLLFLARRIAADDALLTQVVADPLVRRLMVLYAWTRSGEMRPGATKALLAAVEPLAAVEGADQLAALAYDAGRYDLAARWAALSPTPLAAWLRAKLAVRDGDLDRAAREYRVVAATLHEAEPLGSEQYFTAVRLQGERGVLALAREEYVEALETLIDAARRAPSEWPVGPGWQEAAYVAERVLTLDELVAFVDRQIVRPDDPIGADLRALLARRLVRAGRVADSLRYFDAPEVRAAAEAYGRALSRAGSGTSVDRAKGWLEAAAVARPGLDLLGTEIAPDFAVFEASFERAEVWAAETRFRTAEESGRVAASSAVPDRRYHYRAIASRQAEQAADLLSPRSQAYAVALCRAAMYARDIDPERYAALWRRYVATGPALDEPMDFGGRCPEPDWVGAEVRRREDLSRVVWLWVWPLVLAVAGALGVWRLRSRT